MNHDRIRGLAPRKLARILGLSLTWDQKDEEAAETDVAGLLEQCLMGRVPERDNRELTWTDLLEELKTGQESREGTVLLELLTSRKSSLKAIRAVRRCAKNRAARNSMDPEYSVAITIYFSAIANALVFRGTKITTHSYDSLEKSFGRLAGKPWMPEELGILLQRAGDYCRSRR